MTKEKPLPDTPVTDRPLAMEGLISYRAKSPYGWIMIGATDDAHALSEARRSSPKVEADDLQIWDGLQYIPLASARDGDVQRATEQEVLQHVDSKDKESTDHPSGDAPS